MKQIIPLFPVPIYFSQLTRKINKTENAFVEKQKSKLKIMKVIIVVLIIIF